MSMDQDKSYHGSLGIEERTQDWGFESSHQAFDLYTSPPLDY